MKRQAISQERGQAQIIIIFILLFLCAVLLLTMLPWAEMFPGAVTIKVNRLADMRPFMMVETMDPQVLEGDNRCNLYIRGTFLNGTGTIPSNGKFACLNIPPDAGLENSGEVTFLLGSIGYEPTPNLAERGAYYEFTIVGFMPAIGVLPVREGIVYNPDFDRRFQPEKPRSNVYRDLFGCMMNMVETRDISVFLPCEQAGYFPTGEIVWQGPYGEYNDRVWIAAVDSGRIKLFPLSAYPEMAPLLGTTFASEDFFKQAVEIINSQPEQNLLPWDGLLPLP